MGVYEEQIVPIKISRLAEYVAQRKHIFVDEGLVYVYTNPMYNKLLAEYIQTSPNCLTLNSITPNRYAFCSTIAA